MLDEIDTHILRILQNEGRITATTLAENVGLTAPPCQRRMRNLEDTQVIQSYHARVDAKKLGYGIIVFALVSLTSQAESDLRDFEAHIDTLELVRECYMLNGEIDFILKIVAPDLPAFQEFLTSSLTTAPHVAHVRTSLTIRTSKNLFGVPIA
jgi:DNA-binding Lrp family transcriptional regulator